MISLLLSAVLYQNIMITEVQIKGETTNQSHIEIFNPNSYDLDLSGYRLRKRSSTGKEYSIRVFPKGVVIKARDYLLWANSRDDYHLKVNADLSSSATISNNNSIALFTPEGEVVDSVAWGQGTDQFVMGSPVNFNPSRNNGIRRIEDENGYLNNGDNSLDFRVEPETLIEVPSTSIKTERLGREEKSQAPMIAFGLALTSSLLILALKRSINYGGS